VPEWIPGVSWEPGAGTPNDNLTLFVSGHNMKTPEARARIFHAPLTFRLLTSAAGLSPSGASDPFAWR
jgi:hypothetical protein